MMYGRIYLTSTDLTVCFFFVQFIQMKEPRPHRIAGVALSSDLTNDLKTNCLMLILYGISYQSSGVTELPNF